jgi:DNA-binding NarL/FixJ family response regulator
VPIRVLVVDDHDSLRELFALCLSLEDDLELVGVAGDGLEAIDVAVATQPDVIVLDCALPVLDGLETLPVLTKAVPHAAVIMFSAWSDAALARLAMARGAQGYLVKSRQDVTDVVAEIRRIGHSMAPHHAA